MNMGLLRLICGGRTSVLLGLSSVFLLAACEQDRVSPQPRLTVEIYEVGQAIVKRERTFHGRVVPADLTRVSFRIPGKIDHLAVQAGQRVVQGQILAQIEDSIQSQVLAHARARHQLSRRQLERAENLHKRDALTSAQRDQLQASFRLAEANLKLAEAGLSYTLVKAPFDGTVAEVNKELYEAVTAGEAVVTVYRNDRTDVLFNIPDILPAKIHQARNLAALQIRADFSGSADKYMMHYLKGSTARNPKTQAFQIWATMPAPKTPFPPGLPVTITFDLQDAGFSTETGVIVPLTALYATALEGFFQVWRYADGTVNPVLVQVARITQRGALIGSGLQAGDLIAVTGLARLSAGQSVDIQQQNQGSRSL
jgi:RND family efflux transporter MFP subunit